MGAWIETNHNNVGHNRYHVAPLVGAWIETENKSWCVFALMSHPSWVRGLKLRLFIQTLPASFVAPLVGAWIETYLVGYIWI